MSYYNEKKCDRCGKEGARNYADASRRWSFKDPYVSSNWCWKDIWLCYECANKMIKWDYDYWN